VRAVRTVGEPGPMSNAVCQTMAVVSPLVAPTNFRLMP